MHGNVQYIVLIESYCLFKQRFALVTFTTIKNHVEILTTFSQSLRLKNKTDVWNRSQQKTEGENSMESNAAEIKKEIHENIDRITDLELLDFVNQLLLSECG